MLYNIITIRPALNLLKIVNLSILLSAVLTKHVIVFNVKSLEIVLAASQS